MRMTLGVGVILGMAAFAALASPWPFLAPFVVLGIFVAAALYLSMFVAILEPCLLIRGIIKKKIIAKIIINASMIGTLDMPSLKPKSVHVQDFFLSTNSTRLKTPNPAAPPSIVKSNLINFFNIS